jgi:hypothetical protein
LANAIENYTAFAFARAFLISRLFGVWGLESEQFNGLMV